MVIFIIAAVAVFSVLFCHILGGLRGHHCSKGRVCTVIVKWEIWGKLRCPFPGLESLEKMASLAKVLKDSGIS